MQPRSNCIIKKKERKRRGVGRPSLTSRVLDPPGHPNHRMLGWESRNSRPSSATRNDRTTPENDELGTRRRLLSHSALAQSSHRTRLAPSSTPPPPPPPAAPMSDRGGKGFSAFKGKSLASRPGAVPSPVPRPFFSSVSVVVSTLKRREPTEQAGGCWASGGNHVVSEMNDLGLGFI